MLMPALKSSFSLGHADPFGLIHSRESGYLSGVQVGYQLQRRNFKLPMAKLKGRRLELFMQYWVVFFLKHFLKEGV
ncbi:hypothetical protein Nepgr_014136 [Nepenthes gracilis]|uniref:Uncharacterized protein n=1 Tax=Nepenthes gracilis TaxID=150966 RepID=A0AAD3SK54_NEPGR|nr:hypothetical protein Nepgr_014136 [Nepenthes gracilis]